MNLDELRERVKKEVSKSIWHTRVKTWMARVRFIFWNLGWQGKEPMNYTDRQRVIEMQVDWALWQLGDDYQAMKVNGASVYFSYPVTGSIVCHVTFIHVSPQPVELLRDAEWRAMASERMAVNLAPLFRLADGPRQIVRFPNGFGLTVDFPSVTLREARRLLKEAVGILQEAAVSQ
jgi:hypothetical protein